MNKLLSIIDQSEMKKISYYFTFTYSLSDAFPSLCRSKFVTWIIFFISKELLLTFPGKLSTGNKFHQFLFVQENLYFPSLLKDNFAGHIILDLSFFSQCFKYVTSFSLAWKFRRRTVICNFIFNLLQESCLFPHQWLLLNLFLYFSKV